MTKIKKFVHDELTGWKVWEISWLVFACITITTLSIYWGDNVLGIVSATTGVACVICTGKGKLSAYIFGVINIFLYAIIAFQAKYYGEVMLNILYYFPLQFYGFYIWSKNLNPTTKEVVKKKMTIKGFLLLLVGVALTTLVYGLGLKKLGGSLPFVDAFSTTISVVAMIVSIKMYAEQWILWIAVNVVTIYMWGYAFFVQGSESVATLMMWSVYLCNAIIMLIKWYKESSSLKKENVQ